MSDHKEKSSSTTNRSNEPPKEKISLTIIKKENDKHYTTLHSIKCENNNNNNTSSNNSNSSSSSTSNNNNNNNNSSNISTRSNDSKLTSSSSSSGCSLQKTNSKLNVANTTTTTPIIATVIKEEKITTTGYIQPTNVSPNSNTSSAINSKVLNGREARNRAEKNRRDKLNSSIQELSNMVPHVAESQRRVDKTAILRYAAHWLRINYIFNSFKPNLNETGVDAFLKMMEGFFLTVTCRGEIVLVSHSIESHLGHCETDLLGQSIFNFIHPDDHAIVKKQIVPTDIEALFDDDEDAQPRTQEEEEKIDSMLASDKRNFTIRMARAGSRSEPTTYELVKFTGYFRRADSAPRCVKPSSSPAGFQLMRRTRLRDDGIPLHTIRGNDIILNSVGVVIKQTNVCDRLIEACKYEYKTRHLIDGRIVQCDQRISLVAGFMTDEVCGLSPFTFMHRDDVRWVIVALRQMYDDSKPYGESCYRLMARNGQFIYLRTRGYLEIDNNTNRVTTFCCVNTMVSEDEGRKLNKEMKRKYSVIIKSNELAHESEVPSVENPQQIERAVLNLITNLAHNQMQETCRIVEEDVIDQNAQTDDNDDNVSVKSGLSSCHSELDRERKTPPLAIIAPNPCTVKSAITKSLDVIGAAIKGGVKPKSSSSSRSKSNTSSSSGSSSSSNNGNTKRPSVLQKTPPQNTATVPITPSRKIEHKTNLNVIVERTISHSAIPIAEKPDDYYYYDSMKHGVDTDTNMILPHQIKQEYHYSYSSPVNEYNTSYSSYYGSDCEPLTSPQYSDSPQHLIQHQQQQQPQYNNRIHHPAQQTQSNLYNMALNSPTLLESSKSYTYCRSKQMPNINTGLKRSNYMDELDDKESAKRRLDNSYFSLVDDELKNMNRELNQVLPTAFEAIDRSLHHISDDTEELRNSGFPTPHQNQQLNDIIEEHQEQREMLQLLQNDFNSKIQKQQLQHHHQQQQNDGTLYHTNLQSPSALLDDYDSLVLNQLSGISGPDPTDHQKPNSNVSGTSVTTSPS